MLAILMSTALFTLMVLLGIVLMFLEPIALWMIPCFLFALCVIARSYKQPNCRPLEGKDFVWSLLISVLFCAMRFWFHQTIQFHEFWYYYVSVFLSVVMFADSRRFKSLM